MSDQLVGALQGFLILRDISDSSFDRRIPKKTIAGSADSKEVNQARGLLDHHHRDHSCDAWLSGRRAYHAKAIYKRTRPNWEIAMVATCIW